MLQPRAGIAYSTMNGELSYYAPKPISEADVRAALSTGDERAINYSLLDAIYTMEDWQLAESLSIEAARRCPTLVDVQYRYLQNVVLLTDMRRVDPAALDLDAFAELAAAVLERPELELAGVVQEAVDCFCDLRCFPFLLTSPLRPHLTHVQYCVFEQLELDTSDEDDDEWSPAQQAAYEAQLEARLRTIADEVFIDADRFDVHLERGAFPALVVRQPLQAYDSLAETARNANRLASDQGLSFTVQLQIRGFGALERS